MKGNRVHWWVGLFVIVGMHLKGQDAYHQELIDFLSTDREIDDPSFVFSNSEQSNVDGMYLYGHTDLETSSTSDFSFTIVQSYRVLATGSNAWDSGTGHRSLTHVSKDDVVIISFWARKISDHSEVTFFAEDATTFDKELDFRMNFTTDWTQYFGAFKAKKAYGIDGLVIGFHLATSIQAFQIAGFTALNYGDIALSKAPSSFAPQFYGGYEEDAAWRKPAEARIEDIRKKSLVVQVVDGNGHPIPEADVYINMQEHEFGFGSAVVGCRFPGNRCEDEVYLNKILDLDGDGHGFNVAVPENALKWTGWESEWIGTPEETISAIRWLTDRNISVRGHTLVWPGWSHVPDDLHANQTDLVYLRSRINERLETMLRDPDLSAMIDEWDVLNEITQVRDLERAFSQDPNFESGREIYIEILQKAKELQPNLKSYINDYIALSGGGAGSSVINRYKSYLNEIVDAGVDIDGIGFQCHIGSQPTSITKIKAVLDEFSDIYGTRIKITEYDIHASIDEETQAKYMSDFLTMIFSHPAVDAFLMWGFWDGNHWKNNAPIFKQDWSLKSSGGVFIDKVFKDWWTEAKGTTDENGHYTTRVFKGSHKISASFRGVTKERIINTSEGDTIIMAFETTPIQYGQPYSFQLSPNPASNFISVVGDHPDHRINLKIFTLEGKLVQIEHHIIPLSRIKINLPNGIYLIKMEGGMRSEVHKLIIQD